MPNTKADTSIFTHASLFSGIGGFDLAADWMGWQNVFHCEWNPFCQKVLKHHFPNSIPYHDITKTDFTIHRGTIDVLTGGFPCQPYSQAGKRLGKEDERHLWPEMLRAIREIQPGWVVGENVRGLVNWDGGLVFDEVQADLEAEGYEVFPFLLPAAGVDAPHERYRIWFAAYACGDGHQPGRFGISGSEAGEGESERLQRERFRDDAWRIGEEGLVTDSSYSRLQATQQEEFRGTIRHHEGGTIKQFFTSQSELGGVWDNFPTQSPVCDGDDGFSGRLDGLTFSKWRNESIKAGGNAIVPQVVYQIFKSIAAYHDQH